MNSLVQQLRGTLPQITLPDLPPRARWLFSRLRRTASRRRRAIAVAGSLLLHLVFILALLPHAPEGLLAGGSGGSSSGAGTGETYTPVDLYAAVPASAVMTAIRASADKGADALDAPIPAVKPKDDVLQPALANTPQLSTLDTPLPSPTDDTLRPALTTAAMGGAGQAGTTSGAGDDLWKAIAPCWERIAGPDTLPVVLKVTFGADGALAKPPEIVRADAAAITPESLRSESLALAALAQCGAYPMAAGRQGATVNFPRPT